MSAGGGQRFGDIPRIRGTSARSRYPETSTGCAAVDALLGGTGLPLSAIFIIDEDKSRAYAPILSKYFIAEGICCEHSLFIASTSRNPRELLENLPDRMSSDSAVEPSVDGDVARCGQNMDAMKIAWRYSTVPKMDSSLGTGIRHGQLDLSRKMDRQKVEQYDVSIFPHINSAEGELPRYSDLYRQIQRRLAQDDVSVSSSSAASKSSEKRVLRIVVEGVGSPSWLDADNDLKFVAHLRTSLCSSYAVAMIIMNSAGMKAERKERLYGYGDLVVHLDAIENDAKKFNLDDRFDGYFRLLKLPTVSSIATYCPASSDLVFQLQKRKFDIRILHLPPAFDDTDNDNRHTFGSGCEKMSNTF